MLLSTRLAGKADSDLFPRIERGAAVYLLLTAVLAMVTPYHNDRPVVFWGRRQRSVLAQD